MDFESVAEKAREELAHCWEWHEEMATNIPTMDADHQDLAARYNALVHALFQNSDPALFEKCFRSLVSQVRRHFAYEQRLMTDMCYPDYEAHVAEHEKLLKDAEDLTERVTTGVESYDCSMLLQYIKLWLVEHIVSDDWKLARFLHHRRRE